MTESPYTPSPDSETSNSSGAISILSNIIADPRRAFKDIQAFYPVLSPLLFILILNALLVVFMFASIDFDWYIEHMVEVSAGEASKAEQDQVRQGLGFMSPMAMGAIGAIFGAIFIAVIFCVTSLYFVIVSSITNDGFQFKQWLSFVSWTSIPSLVGTLAAFVVILTSTNGQFAPETIDPLSLNALFFELDAIKGAGNILASTNITVFWSIALMTIGYSQWTNKSVAKSLVIVLIPYALYYGARFAMV